MSLKRNEAYLRNYLVIQSQIPISQPLCKLVIKIMWKLSLQYSYDLFQSHNLYMSIQTWRYRWHRADGIFAEAVSVHVKHRPETTASTMPSSGLQQATQWE